MTSHLSTRLVVAACAIAAALGLARAQAPPTRPVLSDPSGLTGVTATSGVERPVTIRVIYDNYVKTDGLTKDWGLSLLIEGLEKRVLFDTGANAGIFAANVSQMKLDLAGFVRAGSRTSHGSGP